jgi:hypothetical protein
MEISVSTNIGNLGDALWMTPLCKKGRRVTINMLNSKFSERLIPIFYNFNVSFIFFEKIIPSLEDNKNEHIAKQYLDKYKINDVSCIPSIMVSDEEMLWAKDFLSKYKNPLVIVADNAGSSDPQNLAAINRKPPIEIISKLTDLYSKKYTLLQFGLSSNFYRNGYSNFTQLNNTIPILDLPLSKLAACYKVIGRYIGGDTGDYHLMLSVGGKANVLIPDHNIYYYNYNTLLYFDDLWLDEIPRVKYVNFRNWKSLENFQGFDY